MPINCLFKCLINSEQSCSKNQFMVNSWTIHEHSCFKKQPFRLSSFVSSSPFLSFPLFSSLFVSLSLCLFLLLSFPLFSSLLVPLSPLLSFFNVHSSWPANSLKTKDLRKRHFWLQIFESRETVKTQNVRRKIRPIICPLLRRHYTPHAARNWPYMLRRETLHHVRFYVGFADQSLHTQRCW